jgi:hypothetical protein
MDAVTQLQNFTRTVAGLMANTLEETQTKSPLLEAGQDLSAKHHEEVEERARRLFQLMQDGACTPRSPCRRAPPRRAAPTGSRRIIVTADVLMASLPEKFESEEEQLRVIAELQAENDAAGARLREAHSAAGKRAFSPPLPDLPVRPALVRCKRLCRTRSGAATARLGRVEHPR